MSTGRYSLYILRCADGTLYTGIAIDVAKRFGEHINGVRGARYLRGRAPFDIVFRTAVGDRSAALRAEYRVKRLSKTDKEALVAGDTSLHELLPQLDGGGSIE